MAFDCLAPVWCVVAGVPNVLPYPPPVKPYATSALFGGTVASGLIVLSKHEDRTAAYVEMSCVCAALPGVDVHVTGAFTSGEAAVGRLL